MGIKGKNATISSIARNNPSVLRTAPLSQWGNIRKQYPSLRWDDTVRAAFDSGRHIGLPLQYAKNETINAKKP